MILTGKALNDFYDWLKCNYYEYYLSAHGYNPYSCNNALVIDWFDSAGLYISIKRFNNLLGSNNWCFVISNEKGGRLNDYTEGIISINSRKEVTKQAILKANEIYNSYKN